MEIVKNLRFVKTLGKKNVALIKRYFKTVNNLPANTSQQNLRDYAFVDNDSQLNNLMRDEYNEFIEVEREKIVKEKQNTKEQKRLERKILSKEKSKENSLKKQSAIEFKKLTYDYFMPNFKETTNFQLDPNKFLIKSKTYTLIFQNKDKWFDYTLKKLFDNKKYRRDYDDKEWLNFFNDTILKIYNKLTIGITVNQNFRIFIMIENSPAPFSTKLGNPSFDDFVKLITSLTQSGDFTELFQAEFQIQSYSIPQGGNSKIIVPNFLIKRGITPIYNDDNFCGQRCLVLADAKNKDDFKNIKKLDKMWSKRAVLISEEIDVKGKMSFTDFDKWSLLRKKEIIILSDLFQVLYTQEIKYPEKVYIYYDAKIEHFHFINDINSATNNVSRNYKWCQSCNKSYRFDTDSFKNHKCIELTCWFCKELFTTKELHDLHFQNAHWTQCSSCNCLCPQESCLSKHKILCKGKRKKCNKCSKYVDSSHFEEHTCNEKKCTSCNLYFEGEHNCFIQPLEKKKVIIDECWAYDFESGFVENQHYVNKCVAMQLFGENELPDDLLASINFTKENETFICNTIEEFVQFVLTKKNTTFIAHNGKAYDTWLVHKHLINNTNKRPSKLILAGNKIMYMVVNSVKFIDSLNHVAQALKTFPETFDLKEMKKGFFPYTFNTPENANYIGEIPEKSFFKPDDMMPKERESFLEWYKSQEKIPYNFKNELLEYCVSDVNILKNAMESYIINGIRITGVNPILSPTIASYAMKVYRTNYLEKNKISILTKEQYDFIKRGFCGGRTEVFQLHAKFTEQELEKGICGKYQDVQSLYPSVQFFDDLTCGSAKWDLKPNFINTKDYLNTHFGFVECNVVCPKNLHIPLLPEKKDGKLIFDLVDKTNAVYSSVELLKAIELGYEITILKSLFFDKCNDLFKGYVQTFTKIKLECSGYFGNNIDNYIERVFNHTGIKLDKENIKFNPGMKLIAKILLNSLWGKFAQRDDLPTTEYYTDPSKWFRLLKKHNDGELVIKNETMIDENTLYVQYISKDLKNSSLNSTNLGLGAMVTSQARLRLYQELSKLDKRVIYCDTDSIIYKFDPTLYNIPEGDLLGQWENETKTPIIEITAFAPKSYGYKTLDGKIVNKCKGVTLNYNNSKVCNFDSMKKLINGKERVEIIKNKEVTILPSISTSRLEFIKIIKKVQSLQKFQQKKSRFVEIHSKEK